MAQVSTKIKPNKVIKSDLAKVSNSLIEAFVKKNNSTALKLIFYIARANIEILENDGLTTISLDTKDLLNYCNIDIKTLRRNIKQMTETSVSIVDVKSESYITVIPYAKFSYNGNLEIKIFSEIMRLIADVKNRFTIVDVQEVMKLSSKHSIRMVMILEMIEGFSHMVAKRKYYTLEELNLIFGTSYKRMGQFEQEILELVKEELDATSKLSFIYEIKYDKDPSVVGRARAIGVTIDLINNKKLEEKRQKDKENEKIIFEPNLTPIQEELKGYLGKVIMEKDQILSIKMSGDTIICSTKVGDYKFPCIELLRANVS